MALPNWLCIPPRRPSHTPHLLLSWYLPPPPPSHYSPRPQTELLPWPLKTGCHRQALSSFRPPQLEAPSRPLLCPPSTLRRILNPPWNHLHLPLHRALHHPSHPTRHTCQLRRHYRATDVWDQYHRVLFVDGVCRGGVFAKAGAVGQFGVW